VISHCHDSPCGVYVSTSKTTVKVLQVRFFWPSLFKDVHHYVRSCDRYERMGNLSYKNEMPFNFILEAKIFDVRGLHFIGPFPSSKGNQLILVVGNYVSKWIEAIASPTNDSRAVAKLFKKVIFARFGILRVIISDNGSTFTEKRLEALLKKYRVQYKYRFGYHPQISGQDKISNREIKLILEKMVVRSWKDWANKLDNTLWAHGTTFTTPIGTTLFY